MADYSWLGPAIQAGAGLAGEAVASGDKAKERELLQRLLQEALGNGVPDLPSVSAQELGPSELEGYRADPELVGAQRAVLARLQGIEQGGGFGIEDRADLARIGNQIAHQQQGARSSIREDLARRGQLGSGEDVASQLALAQQASQQAAQAGLDQSSQALRRRMQALAAQGELAGNLRSQQFSEKSRQAEAADAIRRYNASARERASTHNAGLPAQRFELGTRRVSGLSGATDRLSGYYGNSANDTRGLYAGLGRAGGEAVRGYRTAEEPSAPPLVGAENPDEWDQWSTPYRDGKLGGKE